MKKLLKLLFFLLPIFFLTGCETQQQWESRKREEQYRKDQKEAQLNRNLYKQCTGFGFKNNTPELAQCIHQGKVLEEIKRDSGGGRRSSGGVDEFTRHQMYQDCLVKAQWDHRTCIP
jgi:hypothetical protein